jgi:drug/metabolite transporter (DMT)-like permease
VLTGSRFVFKDALSSIRQGKEPVRMETGLRLLPPGHRQSGNQDARTPRREVKRRLIYRQEREIPPESDVWLNLGLAIVGIAAGAAIAAATVVRNPVTEAILWTASACLTVTGFSYLLVHREVNRGRRLRRSQVIEDVEEI